MSKNRKLRYVVIGVIVLSFMPMTALVAKDWLSFLMSIGGLFLFMRFAERFGCIPGLSRVAISMQVSGLIVGLLYHTLPSMQVLLIFMWAIWFAFYPLKWIYQIQKTLPL